MKLNLTFNEHILAFNIWFEEEGANLSADLGAVIVASAGVGRATTGKTYTPYTVDEAND